MACFGSRVTKWLSRPKCARLTATLASPPPKVAESVGDWRNRSSPGGLNRSMISPKVTTRGITASPFLFLRLWRSRGLHVGHDTRRIGANHAVVSRGDRVRIEERSSDADGGSTGTNPLAGVVDRDATGWYQLHRRKRPPHILEKRRTKRGGGEDL